MLQTSKRKAEGMEKPKIQGQGTVLEVLSLLYMASSIMYYLAVEEKLVDFFL